MANRRMISKDVCASSKFLSLSYGARALLPLLVVEADDEGVVEAEKLRRSGNFRKKHMQELVQELYIIPLDDKCDAAWIRDWDEMNKIPPSRFKESKYHEQVQELRMTHVKGMPDSVKTEPEKPAKIMALSNSHVDILPAQDSKGKDSTVKDSVVVDSCNTESDESRILFTLGSESLTQQDIDELCRHHDSRIVNDTIGRIITKPYYGRLNTQTISEWCEEEEKRVQSLPSRNHSSRVRDNAFNRIPQHDYDFPELENSLLDN